MRQPNHRGPRYQPSGLLLCAGLLLSGGCAAPGAADPYLPVTSTAELMESTIAHAADIYWKAVSITLDEAGEHFAAPANDEEWEAVWSAAISIAESGNLLMIPPRRVDDGNWVLYSQGLVSAGQQAAAAALAQDSDGVLEMGEVVYNACLNCHAEYVGDVSRVAEFD